ncbi:TetR/AcrR family transcriptional regulator [Primorskyibacter sp. S187A]|uniref:TetR/AcrR family transcriptional regulator n=1 Tax=Primorskyibacter sp. S187A TaxID=3415130 RepID=UPI003C7B57CC
MSDAPLLHRDDPSRAPLAGHTKVTREDWLAMARDTLVHDGADQVKILTLAQRMGVSRSSFYWYFRNRTDLLHALLDEWEARNTARITAHCARPAATITEAVCNFFRCFVDPASFDQGLDFAVREWTRRDEALRARVDAADAARIKAVTEMFIRHGYDPEEADARARILYFMQLGYHALDVREPMDLRLSRVGPYLKGFTGQEPCADALAAFIADVSQMEAR